MQKTQLHLFLSKVAQGDESYIPRLCAQLADRLVYAPVLRKREKGKETVTKISVIRILEGDRSIIPVFTALPLLKKWCESAGVENESISLLCADLCGALEKESWLLIDPGTPYSVQLDPYAVTSISSNQEGEDIEAVRKQKWTPPTANVPKENLSPPPGFGMPKKDLTSTGGELGVPKEVEFDGFLLGNNDANAQPSEEHSPRPSRVRDSDSKAERRVTKDLTSVVRNKE